MYGFITDYVKDIFIEEILFDIREKLREVTLGMIQFRQFYGNMQQCCNETRLLCFKLDRRLVRTACVYSQNEH